MPIQSTRPCGAEALTLAQSTRMNVNGQAARIQPIVPAHSDEAELLLGVLHMGESDRVGDRDGRHIEEAVHQHQGEKGPEGSGEAESEHGQAADEVAEAEESLGGEMPVGELVAEEHADDRGQGEGAQDPSLLDGREAQAGQVAEDEGEPGPPDEEFQDHHQEQLIARTLCLSHARSSLMSRRPPGGPAAGHSSLM